MANCCYVCHKAPRVGMKVSHSHRRTKRRWYPNLQPFRASIAGRALRVKVCAKCIKGNKLQKAP